MSFVDEQQNLDEEVEEKRTQVKSSSNLRILSISYRGKSVIILKQKGKGRRRSIRESTQKKEESLVETAMTTPKPVLEQQQSQMLRMKNSGILGYNGSPLMDERDEEMTRSALSAFRAKEEEIERKKMEVTEKVQAHLGRVEEETKRLAEIREELQALADPMRKDVAMVRKRIDIVNKELKPLGQTCQKKEKEYKEALEAFNEKNREKGLLLSKLMELVSESEKLRMKKLEELSKDIESLH